MWNAAIRGVGGAVRAVVRPTSNTGRQVVNNSRGAARNEASEDEPRRAIAPVLLAAGAGAGAGALYGPPSCDDIGT